MKTSKKSKAKKTLTRRVGKPKAKATQRSEKTLPRPVVAKVVKAGARTVLLENGKKPAVVELKRDAVVIVSPALTMTPETKAETPVPVAKLEIPARQILTKARISPHLQGSQEWLLERMGKLS